MTPMPPRFFLRAVLFILMIVPLAVAGAADDAETGIDELMTSYQELGMFNGVALVATDGDGSSARATAIANMEWASPTAPTPGSVSAPSPSSSRRCSLCSWWRRVESPSTPPSRICCPLIRSDIGSEITVHHLLTHTSGLPNYTTLPGFMDEASRNPTGSGSS